MGKDAKNEQDETTHVGSKKKRKKIH